jgi:drug/metabolite transporter (DMT)-like permease
MIALISCVFACALLVIAFKIFERFKISSLVAIVVNYFVAASINFIYDPSFTSIPQRMDEPWFLNGCILGGVFILNLIVMGLSTQKMGASVTSVASKMSLVITVIFTIIYFKESVNFLKIGGIVLAIVSVFFIVQINTKEMHRKFIFLPIILFIGGGFIDSFLKFNQEINISENDSELFAGVTFASAFVGGLIMLIVQLVRKKEIIDLKSVFAGLILGVINWLSIFMLLLTLKNSRLDSSTVYTYVNIGILLVVVASGVLIFKEKLRPIQWIGVVLAIGAIVLISIADVNKFI